MSLVLILKPIIKYLFSSLLNKVINFLDDNPKLESKFLESYQVFY